MKLVERDFREKFRDDGVLKEEVLRYFYNDEDERNNHAKELISKGYTDSGQIKENVGSIMNAEFVWCGYFSKFELIAKPAKELDSMSMFDLPIDKKEDIENPIQRSLRLSEIKKTLDNTESMDLVSDTVDGLSEDDAKQLLRKYVYAR